MSPCRDTVSLAVYSVYICVCVSVCVCMGYALLCVNKTKLSILTFSPLFCRDSLLKIFIRHLDVECVDVLMC